MKVYFKTLGCEKNTVDTECAMGLLESCGFVITDNPAKSDIMIVNTCGFINDAKQQSIETIFDLIRIKTEKQKLIVSGCLSQRYHEELANQMPEVDYFLGVNDYDKLPSILNGITKERVFANKCGKTFEEIGHRSISDRPWTASIKIAEGCNNVCAYCIIPFIRGRYRSRKPKDILSEAKYLAENGCKELVVIAQDVTYYGKDFGKDNMLPKLLKDICKIDGIKWVRLMYCYEDEITPELIKVIKNEPKIVKYIDIPIQHSSNKILKAMNRKSTRESITKTVNTLRKEIPDIVIRTTLITGFPGETQEDFKDLYKFVSQMRFDRLGVFAYSREEGTKAYSMPKQVRSDVKQRRLDKIMQLQKEISLEHNLKLVGKTVDLIIDEVNEDGTYLARTEKDAEIIDNGVILTSKKKLKPGTFVKAIITDAFDYDLTAEAIE